MKRRDFIKDSAVSGLAIATSSPSFDDVLGGTKPSSSSAQSGSETAFWPDGARLVISISMQMEAGAQPLSGAESPMPKLDPLYPDLPAVKWYEYGFKEGLPRLLDMFDRRKVKVTSHMVGATVDLHPALAKEIVQRGHEASGHGQTWAAQYSMTPDQERESYRQSIASIERATGTRPVGFNAFWLRGTPHTLEILQELGFIYYIDDVSRDEPLAFVLIDVMNGSDVRMIEGRCGSGFSLEALQRLLTLGQVFGQELERYQAEQLRVFGLVDHARAAAELFQDVIMGNSLPNH